MYISGNTLCKTQYEICYLPTYGFLAGWQSDTRVPKRLIKKYIFLWVICQWLRFLKNQLDKYKVKKSADAPWQITINFIILDPLLMLSFTCRQIVLYGIEYAHSFVVFLVLLPGLTGFMWYIYNYSLVLLHWHWGNLWLPQCLGPVSLQWSDAVERIPANGSAAFNESCTAIG